jgi:hypothetical protein
MDVYDFTLIYAGLGLLAGSVVYLVFYVLFQKLAAARTPVQRDEVSRLIVMGGFTVEEPSRLSAIRILKDILMRSLGSARVSRLESFAGAISSWYLLALILLSLLVAISFMLGW